MIDEKRYEETDHPELVEFEGETLGDTLTNLLTEVERLREGLQEIVSDFDTKKTDKWRMLNRIKAILKGDD